MVQDGRLASTNTAPLQGRSVNKVFKLIRFLRQNPAPSLGITVPVHRTISAALTKFYNDNTPSATHGSIVRGLAIALFFSPLINHMQINKLLNDKELCSYLPPGVKPPVVAFKYTDTLGRRWFNYILVARLLLSEHDSICASECICHRFPHLIPAGLSCINTTDIRVSGAGLRSVLPVGLG